MFEGFRCVLLFILASNRFFSQSHATETNSINGIFAFSRRSFNSAHLTWTSQKRNKSLTILALFLSGAIQTNPGPRHEPTYPCGFCELAVSWSCLEMCTKDYSLLQRSNVQGLWCRCQTRNTSSFTLRKL